MTHADAGVKRKDFSMDIFSMLQHKLGESDLLTEIASRLGVEQREVVETAEEGLPAMLEGMRRNAASKDGAASLSQAIAEHARQNVNSVQDVDQTDGQKILGHIFGGDNSDLGQRAGLFDQKKGGILAMLAPILMNLLGKRQAQPSNDSGFADLGSILGGGEGGGLMGGLKGFLDKDGDGRILDDLGDMFRR